MSGDTTGTKPFARVEPNDGSWDDLIIDEAAPFHLMLKDAHQAARRLNSAVAARERAAAADAERRYQDAKAAIVAHAKSLGGTVYFRGEIIDADATLSDCRAMSRGREFVSRGIDTQRMERAAAAKALREVRKLHVYGESVFVEYRGPDAWAVTCRGSVLGRTGEWEYEPMPSSRDDDFIKRTRFATIEEAIERARASADAIENGNE